MEYVIIAVCAFILSIIFVPAAIKIAFTFGVMDKPNQGLKRHKKSVPYLGGIAIFLAFLIPVIAAKFILHQTFHGVYGIMIGAFIMLVMGFLDDLYNLSAYLRLGVQFAVALVLVRVNLHIKFMDNNILNIGLTVLWVIGITNAMNIIDIMDGLAGGVAAVAAMAFFIMAAFAGRINDMIPAIALFGAVLGFLIYNKPPAKIYMGDAGALFLGFMLSSLALNESYSTINYIAVLAPILILIVPIFDTTLVSFIRVSKGMLPLHGSNDHLAQRLVMLGLSKTQTVALLILLSIIMSALAIISTRVNFSTALIIYLGAGFFVMFAGFVVGGVDMSKYHKVDQKRK
ncbi:MAG: MraY family glycosyltransferase [bacterium]